MAVAGVVVEQTPNIQLSMTISDNMMIYCMPLSLIFMLETEHYSLSWLYLRMQNTANPTKMKQRTEPQRPEHSDLPHSAPSD